MRLDLQGPRPRLDLDDPALRLTGPQREALVFDREVVVTAGAGAGKTHTLSLRYVVLLLELAVRAVDRSPRAPRPDVEGVLVLTFTEKAAEEMAERCYRRLLALSDAVRREEPALERYGQGYGRRLAAAVDHLLDTFDAARISTFHGFCARILRDFPAEGGVDPAFEVLEKVEAEAILQLAIRDTIEARLRSEPDALAPVLDAVGSYRRLVEALRQLLSDRGRLEPALRPWVDGSHDLATLVRGADPSPDAVGRFLEGEGREVLSRIVEMLEPCRGSCASDGLRPLLARIATLPSDPLPRYALYRDVLDALCTNTGRARKLRSLAHHAFVGKKGDWTDAAAFKAAKEALGALEAELDWLARDRQAALLPVPADAVLVDVLRGLASLAVDGIARLDEALDRRRAVDFSALQLRAVQAVLRHPDLLARLHARHRYVMVDEFQDTDELQWALVRAIGRPAGEARDRIFLVGDAKQAIYRFRGGDVTVFRTACDDLGVEPVVLPDNFRSRPSLITWFNGVFGTILGARTPDRAPWEAPYDPLRAGRDATGGTITLVLHEEGGGAEAAATEAEALARWVGSEVLGDGAAFADLALRDRAVHPSPPIAILLRARTHLPVFEAALRRHGIPFVVAGGVGFWERPEVLDLVNALHALATGDPLSLVGALRSPLFGLHDQAIQDLVDGRLAVDGRNALYGFGRRALVRDAPTAVQEAATRWRRLLALRDRLAVSELLRELVDDASAWHLYALRDPRGQARANVEQLLAVTRRFDGRGPDGLDEVARFCLGQVEEESREAEAAVAPTEARVVLLTVHASKGLEFPVVAVPLLASIPPTGSAPLVVGRLEGAWSVACKVLDPDADVQRAATPGTWARLAAQRDAEDLAERQRLLYVAATRARDHLLLLGSASEAPADSPRTWMEMLEAHHGAPATSDASLQVRPASDILALPTRPLTAQPTPVLPDVDASRRIGAVPAPVELEVAPSSLDLFASCPARWYRRHLLRVPEQPRGARDLDRALAAVRGDVLHSLLEDDVADDPEVARRRLTARALAEGCPPDRLEPLLERLLEHLQRITTDPRIREVLDAPGYPELGFRVPYRHLVVRGQIDRLWLDRTSGEWVVLDWKSERVEGSLEEAARGHARQVLAYAWAATRVLAPRGHPPVRRAELVFTDRGATVPVGPLDDEALRGFEALLDQVADVSARDWETVEAEATRTGQPRPCNSCGFFGHGCRGIEPTRFAEAEQPRLL